MLMFNGDVPGDCFHASIRLPCVLVEEGLGCSSVGRLVRSALFGSDSKNCHV